MKLYHYIGIHLIASKNIDIEKLSIELETYLQKYLPHPHLTLETNEPYWKDLTTNSIVYSVLNNENIKIIDILNSFPISWNYSDGYVFNVEIQQRVNNEDAIWSQLGHPKETFLISEVRWVHIYTWETNQEPIVS